MKFENCKEYCSLKNNKENIRKLMKEFECEASGRSNLIRPLVTDENGRFDEEKAEKLITELVEDMDRYGYRYKMWLGHITAENALPEQKSFARLMQLGEENYEKFNIEADRFFEAEFLDKLTENLQRDILTVDVHTLLYDAGFSNGGRPRKKDKSMDIMDAYFRYVGDNPFSGGTGYVEIPGGYTTWDEYYNACDNVRDRLNSDKRASAYQNVFMPMWIDNDTGGGIFLIGKRQFAENADVRLASNCEFGVVYFYGTDGGSAFEFSAFQEGTFDENVFPGMSEAVSWFRNYDYKADSMEEYRRYNGDAPAGCPEVFLKYFKGYDNVKAEVADISGEVTGNSALYGDVDESDIRDTLEAFDREQEEKERKKRLRMTFQSPKIK